MSRFIIKGGRPISGTHRTPGNKNAALPMLAASLLTEEPVTLTNVPGIRDVETMLGLVRELGGAATRDPDAAATRELAAAFGACYVPAREALLAARTALPDVAWTSDGCHPTTAGHALIATAWLKAVNVL